MKYKKLLVTGLLVLTMTTSLIGMSGCSAGTTNTDTAAVSIVDTTLTGTVSSVDGSTIVMTIGSNSMGSMGMGQNGGQGGADGQTPPDMGDGQAPEESSADESAATGTDEEADASAATDTNAETNTNAEEGAGTTKDSGASSDSEAPEAPDGDGQAPDGQAPDGMGGNTSGTEVTVTVSDTSVLSDGLTIDDITEGTMLSVVVDADGKITSISISDSSTMGGGPGGDTASSGVSDYSAATEYTEDTTVDNENFSSAGTDENAVLVKDGAEVTLNNITLDRTSSDSTGGDNSSFYGVGAGLLTTDGTTCVNGGTFTTDAAGGAGIFAYGDGTVYASDATIRTTQDTSGGIHAAGGGTFYAWNLDVETQGASSAAIRSDRGGGTMVVDGGTYTSNGSGSPAVYCTADISINNATLNATGAEAVCIEGLNTLRLFDCDLTGNMPDDEQNDSSWDVILYQSMSGDSEVGNSTFEMVGGTLTSENGGLFYTTNTESDFILSNVDIQYSDDATYFLQCTGNTNQRGWGTAGDNGAQCVFTADNQAMQGKVIYDSISTLDFYMTNGSTFHGSFEDDETYAGNGKDGYCNVYISAESAWTVAGDSVIQDLYNAGTIVDEQGNTVSITGTDGTSYVAGTSSYTITVSSYSTEDKSSEAVATDSFSDYAVEQPQS